MAPRRVLLEVWDFSGAVVVSLGPRREENTNMSTDYAIVQPLTARQAAKLTGWELGTNASGSTTLTDGKNFVHWDEIDHEEEGKTRLVFTRYGLNDPSGLIDALNDKGFDVVDEYEDDFQALMGYDLEEETA
jgi:hypothetical protein